MAGRVRCIKRSVRIVRKNAKSLSSPGKTVRFTARTVFQSAKIAAVKRIISYLGDLCSRAKFISWVSGPLKSFHDFGDFILRKAKPFTGTKVEPRFVQVKALSWVNAGQGFCLRNRAFCSFRPKRKGKTDYVYLDRLFFPSHFIFRPSR